MLMKPLRLFFTDADPKNYLSYYRRATVYLALGKAKHALPDLQQVLKMKPDFLAVCYRPFLLFPVSLEIVSCLNDKRCFLFCLQCLLVASGSICGGRWEISGCMFLWYLCSLLTHIPCIVFILTWNIFPQARLQRGNVHLKLGNLDQAHIDFENVVSIFWCHINVFFGEICCVFGVWVFRILTACKFLFLFTCLGLLFKYFNPYQEYWSVFLHPLTICNQFA